MTIFNFGSINIDHVYQVAHFVRPGETLTSDHYQKILGGKGANQSIALAKANCPVIHIGAIDNSDQSLLTPMTQAGVNIDHVATLAQASGHAIIQVNQQGENAIVLFAGANHQLNQQQIDQALAQAQTGDWVLLQNETNAIGQIIGSAKARGLTVVYNPAPMNKALVESHISEIDILIVNEVEAMDLFAVDCVAQAQLIFQQDYPNLTVILTLGVQGVRYLKGSQVIEVAAFNVTAIDTTAAGDTFIGYCLAGLIDPKHDLIKVLTQACAASAICVTREGASSSIPTLEQVIEFGATNVS